jgi:hypothetical protein
MRILLGIAIIAMIFLIIPKPYLDLLMYVLGGWQLGTLTGKLVKDDEVENKNE